MLNDESRRVRHQHQIAKASMSDQPPRPLASGADLRHAANVCRVWGDHDKPQVLYAQANRLDILASTLDRLHATPGLAEAIEHIDSHLSDHPIVRGTKDHWSIRTVLAALRCVYPPTPSST